MGGRDLSIAGSSLGSPSLPAPRSQAMTGRFRASRPGCSSQLTTPIEAGARTPWQSTAAIRVSGSVSHPGQGRALQIGRVAPGVS